MPVAGRKPKPPGQAVNRVKPTHDWTEVPDVPFRAGRKLPRVMPSGDPWPARTKQWWLVVAAMPHAALWSDSDWGFALDTAQLAAEFHCGEVKVATELRNREKVLGTTHDFRRDLRIRYVLAVSDEGSADGEAATVTQLDEYRGLYG